MTTPTASCFDWNKTPYLVKEMIVENLTPRTLPLFASLSSECYYLYHNLRSLHIVHSLSILIKIEEDGKFQGEIVEGDDVDDEIDRNENIFDRNASSHLGIEFKDPTKLVFENLREFKKFLKHIHVIGSMELDISCRDSEEAEFVLNSIWEELSKGFESVQKVSSI